MLKHFTEKNLRRPSSQLLQFRGQTLMGLNLDAHGRTIAKVFNRLSKIPGIEFTGAAKILHLLNREVFVMWDRYIGGHYPKKHYLELDVVKSGFWPIRKFEWSGDGYIDFLLQCQNAFHAFTSPKLRKSVAKCIDEFNYCKITVPIAKAVRAK